MIRFVIAASEILKPDDLNTLPQPNVSSGADAISKVLQLVFGIAGAAALIIIMIGALKYVTSQGNPQETNKAKDTILYAVIGLVICIMAFAIVTFVVSNL